MDQTLSSLIAFVGFLIVLSMLIQSVQEALKNLFKLKSGVWERFFITLYQTEFNYRAKKELTPKTFWQRVASGSFVGEFDQRLKRLRTVILKADDRFKQIRQILRETETLDLADAALAKDTFDRLYQALIQAIGLKIDSLIPLYDKSRQWPIRTGLLKLQIACASLDTALAQGPEKTRSFCRDMDETVRQLEKSLATYKAQIETKADAWLVQLEGEYKKNMLKWTLLISTAVVLILNADAFTIYAHFSLSSKARSSMEASAQAVLQLDDPEKDGLKRFHERMNQAEPDLALKAGLDLAKRLARRAEAQNHATGKEEAGQISTQLEQLDPKSGAKILEDLEKGFMELALLQAELDAHGRDQAQEALDRAGLPLGWVQDWQKIWPKGGPPSGREILKKICGLTLTIFLVSFGAPFWQNIMTALIGVRQISRTARRRREEGR